MEEIWFQWSSFKRKTLPKIKFSSGVFVYVYERGQMDERGVNCGLIIDGTSDQGSKIEVDGHL